MATKDRLGWTIADYDALLATAARLGLDPAWLAAVIYSETSFDPSAHNSLGYRGLIQFGKNELHGMGLSEKQVDDFIHWSPVRQMPFVERYLKYWAPADGWISRAQIYQATFLPSTIARLGSKPEVVLARKPADGCPSPGNVFCANAVFSRDGKTITVGDLEAKIVERINSPWSKFATAQEGVQAASDRRVAITDMPAAPAGQSATSITPIALYNPSESRAFSTGTMLVAGLAIGLGSYYFLRNQQRPALTT